MNKQECIQDLQAALNKYIEENHHSVEDFCWCKGLNKATVSNLLNSRKDFQISTLEKIANSMGKKVKIILV